MDEDERRCECCGQVYEAIGGDEVSSGTCQTG